MFKIIYSGQYIRHINILKLNFIHHISPVFLMIILPCSYFCLLFYFLIHQSILAVICITTTFLIFTLLNL